jgi:uncharacterized SAM-binding protein YcdF (DUF218 family)
VVLERIRISRLLVTTFATIGGLVIFVTATPVVGWWADCFAVSWNEPTGDVLVVLAGSLEDDGGMGESTYRRSIYAALFYREHGFTKILVSGGGLPKPIAETMKEFLVFRGVPADAIHIEVRSTNTRENGLYSREILASMPGKKVLLTSDYHMARAYGVFRKLGVEVTPLPIPDVRKRVTSPENRWGTFILMVRESAALVYYFFRRWI